ncbi:MAG: Panacea domain-containing protein [Gemmataceae bacterium]
MATAQDVVHYLALLAQDDPEAEVLSPLRLQKLLYFCQGWHLAWFDTPLFSDEIQAWQHGPVVRNVWGQPIPSSINERDLMLTAEQKSAIQQVWNHYRQFSAWGLREISHGQAPWKNHYVPDLAGRCSQVIPHHALRKFFGNEYEREKGIVGDAAQRDADAVPLTTQQLQQVLGW